MALLTTLWWVASKVVDDKGLKLEVTDIEAQVAEQETKDSKGKGQLAEGLNGWIGG